MAKKIENEETQTDTTVAGEVEEVKTLTLSAIGAEGIDCVKQDKPVFMGRFMGIINGTMTKRDKRTERDFTVCMGQFRAINNAGNVFEADKMIFPGSLGESIVANAQVANGKAESLKFAIDVFADPDAKGARKSPMGYSYRSKSLIAHTSRSLLAEVEADIEAAKAAKSAK